MHRIRLIQVRRHDLPCADGFVDSWNVRLVFIAQQTKGEKRDSGETIPVCSQRTIYIYNALD